MKFEEFKKRTFAECPNVKREYERLKGEKRDAEISRLLKGVGIPPSLLGYGYIKSALLMILDDPSMMIGKMTKELYPGIAKQFGTTSARVERSIRHAIEVAFCNMPPQRSYEYFGYCINANKGKATNSEFLAMLAQMIKESEMQQHEAAE